MHSSDHLEDIYLDHVLPHAESPAHRGRLETSNGSGAARNPACGDQVCLEVALDADGRIVRAVHEVRGCVISRAAAELLCRRVEGRTLHEAERLMASEALDLLEVPLSAARRRCGLVAYEALGRLLKGLAAKST